MSNTCENKPTERPFEFFVTTSDFDWGKGATLGDALNNAHFDLNLDWVKVYVGHDLRPGACGCAEGDIVVHFKMELAKYRRR